MTTTAKKLRATQAGFPRFYLLLPFVLVGILVFNWSFYAGTTLSQGGNPTPVPFYNYDIVALTGDLDLIEIKPGVSINKQGTIAFAGTYSNDDGDALLVADDEGTLQEIANGRGKREFHPTVQLNDADQIIALDKQPGQQADLTKIRIWDGTKLDADTQLASGQVGVPDANYDEVFAYPTINNAGKAVFAAVSSHQPQAPGVSCTDHCLAMPRDQPLPPNTYPFDEVGMEEVERPMLADDGTVVVRTVSGNRTQIVVYRNGLSALETVASTSMGFTELGRSPAISDGGQLVAFYGSLDATAAQARGMTAGPAIFGALYIDGNWVIRQIAATNGPGALNGFEADARVGVSDARKFVYIAYDSRNNKGIYSSQLNFFSVDPADPTAFVPNAAPAWVAKVGTALDDLGVVTDLAIHDPVNIHGQVGFWVTTASGEQAVVRGDWRCAGRTYEDPSTATYVNQYSAGRHYGLPFRFGKRGGNACGPASFITVINAYRAASGSTVRLDIEETSKKVMRKMPADNISNSFNWSKGRSYAKSLGFTGADFITGTVAINEQLAKGIPVIVSNRFSSKTPPALSKGHVMTFWGRTPDGDYIVSDPAGDYFSSRDDHYNRFSCGEYRIYPENEVTSRLLNNSGTGPREALIIPPVNTTLQAAHGQTGVMNRGTTVLLAIGNFDDTMARPYTFWLEDGNGRRTGYQADGTVTVNIPESDAFIDPIVASNPDDDWDIPEENWPYAVEVVRPASTYRVVLAGLETADYELELISFDNGEAKTSVLRGTIAAGQTVELPIVVDQIGNDTETATPTASATSSATSTVQPAATPTMTPTQRGVPTDDGRGPSNDNHTLFLPITMNGSGNPDRGNPTSAVTPTATGVQQPSPTPTMTPTGMSGQTPTPLPTPPDTLPPLIGDGYSASAAAGLGLGKIQAAAFSSDGARFVVGGDRGGALIVNTTSGVPELSIDGHAEPINAVAFAADGAYVFTGSEDGSAHMWNATTGSLIRIFRRTGRNEAVSSLALSADGRYLLTGVKPNVISGEQVYVAILWDVNTGTQVQVFEGHTGSVRGVDMTRDGTTAVTASDDRSVRLWNVDNGALIRTFTGHTASVHAVSFSTDESRVASGSGDGTARIWTVATGAFVRIEAHTNSVNTVALTADGSRLVTTSKDLSAAVWDASTGALIHRLDGQRSEPIAAAFAPNTNQLLTGDNAGIVRLWNIADPVVRKLAGSSAAVKSIAVSPDGTLILSGGPRSGSNGGVAYLWDVETGTILHTLDGHTQSVVATAFSPDGTFAVTGSQDRSTRVWNTTTGELLHTLMGDSLPVHSVAVAPNGQLIATGSSDRLVRLWNSATGDLVDTITGATTTISGVDFAPDGNHLLIASNDATVRVWSLTERQVTLTYHQHEQPSVYDVAYMPNGIHALSSSSDRHVYLWDSRTGATRLFSTNRQASGNHSATALATSPDGGYLFGATPDHILMWAVESGELVHQFSERLPSNRFVSFNDVATTPDGEWVVGAGEDGVIYLWLSQAGTVQSTNGIGGHSDGIDALALSPDGRRLLTGGWDSNVLLWDTETGNQLQRWHGHQRDVHSAAFSRNGQFAATGDAFGQVRVWSVADGTIVRTLKLPSTNDTAFDIAFSPDDTLLVIASSNGDASLWNLATGEQVRLLDGHAASVTSVVFSADGTQILTGSDDSSALLWETGTGAILGSFGGHTEGVTDVAFAPNNTMLTASADGRAIHWNIATGQMQQTLMIEIPSGDSRPPRRVPLQSIAVAPNGEHVLLGDVDGDAHLWELATGELVQFYAGHRASVLETAFTSDGTEAITAGARTDHTVRFWPVMASKIRQTIENHTASVAALALSPDGRQLLSGGCDQAARLWDLGSATNVYEIVGHSHSISPCVSFAEISPDGQLILTGTGAGLRLSTRASGQFLRIINAHRHAIRSARFSADSRYIVTAGDDRNPASCFNNCGSAKVWDAQSGDLLQTLTHDGTVTAATISEDGGLVLTGAHDGVLRLWSRATGELLRSYAGHGASIRDLSFSPGMLQAESMILSSDTDGLVMLREWNGGTIRHVFSHQTGVTRLAFAPAGNRIVTISGNSTFVWDTVAGRLLHVVSHKRPVNAVVFAENGAELMTGGDDQVMKVWSLQGAE